MGPVVRHCHPAVQSLDEAERLAGGFHTGKTSPPALVALAKIRSRADGTGLVFSVKELRKDSTVTLGDIAATARARIACKELASAARAWQAGCKASSRHIEAANALAASIPDPEPLASLRGLLQHHEARGGGLRWFV